MNKPITDYWEQKIENEKRKEFKTRLIAEQKEEQRKPNFANTCPHCYIIRSPYEAMKGTCDNCDFTSEAAV